MHRSRIVALALGVLLVSTAGVVEALTWWGGTELAAVVLTPSGDTWVGAMSGVAIPTGGPVVVDLAIDYDYAGDVAFALDARLASSAGETAQLSAEGQDDEGGQGASDHERSESFTPTREGTWSAALVLRTRGDIHVRAATATLRARPIDLHWLGLLLGVLGGLALTAGIFSQKISWGRSET